MGLFIPINGISISRHHQQYISQYTGKHLASLPPHVSRVLQGGAGPQSCSRHPPPSPAHLNCLSSRARSHVPNRLLALAVCVYMGQRALCSQGGCSEPLACLGEWPPYTKWPQQVRPGEVAQLFSDPLGPELTEDEPAMRASSPVLPLSSFLEAPLQESADLPQKVLWVCR